VRVRQPRQLQLSSTGEYMKAISYFEMQYTIAEELELEAYLGKAARGMGVAMRLHVRADRQAASASQALIPAPGGASHLSGPRSSASASLEDRVKEPVTWLKTALAARHGVALLRLTHLTYDAEQEDTALAYLEYYLDWCVERGRAQCNGCSKSGARTRRCSRAAAAVLRIFAAQIIRRWPRNMFRRGAVCTVVTRTSVGVARR
jgi:hypothetical protein